MGWCLRYVAVVSVMFAFLGISVCSSTRGDNIQGPGTPDDNSKLGCAKGWRYFKGKCFRLHEDYETWDAATSTCRIQGGRLAFAKDKVEFDFIRSMINEKNHFSYWYGVALYKRGIKYNAYTTTGHYTLYLVKQVLGYLVYMPEPSFFSGPVEGQCLSLYKDFRKGGDYMMSLKCQTTLTYICKMPHGTAPQKPDSHFFNSSATDWFWFSDAQDMRSQAEAEKKCRQMSMTLATLRDEKQRDLVLGEIQRRQGVEHFLSLIAPWWIGLEYKTGKYSWTNSDVVNNEVITFQKGIPYKRILSNLLPDGTIFSGFYIRDARAPFICMVDEAAKGKHKCDPGWTRGGNSCYFMPNSFTQNINVAQKICALKDSHVISLETEQERVWFRSSRYASLGRYIWTSLEDRAKKSHYTWGNKTALDTSINYWEPPLNKHRGVLNVYAILESNGKAVVRESIKNKVKYPGCQFPASSGRCPSPDWFQHGENCYYLKNGSNLVTYDTNLHPCYQSLGPYNLNVTVQRLVLTDQDLVKKYNILTGSVWLAKVEFRNRNPVWPDGTPLNQSVFDFTAQPDPGTTKAPKSCAAIDPRGFLRTLDCSVFCVYICEKELVLNSSAVTNQNGVFVMILSVFFVLSVL